MANFVDSKLMRVARSRQRKHIQEKHTPHEPANPQNLVHNIPMFRRIQCALFAGLIGLILGGLLDLGISVLRTLSQPQASAEFVWFLAYVFASIGLLAGFFFGSRAGELFAQVFGARNDDDMSSTGELMRLVAKVLLGAALIWGAFLLFI